MPITFFFNYVTLLFNDDVMQCFYAPHLRTGKCFFAYRESTDCLISIYQSNCFRMVNYLQAHSPMDADEDLLLELLFKM